MCTDVDRNDKSRICEPGSVQVIGRRQIELYSHLIHTVDHVEGTLRSQFDALDAFFPILGRLQSLAHPKKPQSILLNSTNVAPDVGMAAQSVI